MINVRNILGKLRSMNPLEEGFKSHIFLGLSEQVHQNLVAGQGFSYTQGKVRDIYSKKDKIFLVHSDRLSAFDCIITQVPYKGCILNLINKFWQEKAQGILPSYYIQAPHSRILEGRYLSPIKIEVVVRAYLAGSMLRDYEKGERVFWGTELPDGLAPYTPLPHLMITPTSKEEIFKHDEPISVEQILKRQLCTDSEWQKICQYSLDLFKLGQEVFAQKGWLLVDTKYEFGRGSDGAIFLIDEAHTPDSSRLWQKSTYAEKIQQGLPPEMFDKENIRRFLLEAGFMGEGDLPMIPGEEIINLSLSYLDILESLIEKPLVLKDPNVISADFFK